MLSCGQMRRGPWPRPSSFCANHPKKPTEFCEIVPLHCDILHGMIDASMWDWSTPRASVRLFPQYKRRNTISVGLAVRQCGDLS